MSSKSLDLEEGSTLPYPAALEVEDDLVISATAHVVGESNGPLANVILHSLPRALSDSGLEAKTFTGDGASMLCSTSQR